MNYHGLDHDLYREASSRRDREVDSMLRTRSHQRAAKSKRQRTSPAPRRRFRLMAVAAPTLALLTAALATGLAG